MNVFLINVLKRRRLELNSSIKHLCRLRHKKLENKVSKEVVQEAMRRYKRADTLYKDALLTADIFKDIANIQKLSLVKH